MNVIYACIYLFIVNLEMICNWFNNTETDIII